MVAEEQVLIGGVRTHVYRSSDPSIVPKVVLVLAHGRNSDHKSTEEIALEVCKKVPECVCATYDQPNHGSRIMDKSQNSSWKSGNRHHFPQMLGVIEQSLSEVSIIHQFLPAYFPDLANLKQLVTGVSLGGHISWYAGASGIADGIAPIIGCPDLVGMFHERASKETGYEKKDILPEVVLEIANRRKQQIAKLQNSTIPILAICGEEDTLVPPHFSKEFFASDHQPNHELVTFPGAGHEVTPAMVTKLCEWVTAQIK